MKKRSIRMLFILLILAALFPIPSLEAGSKSLPNPAAVYCSRMGFPYEIRIDQHGNAYGVCVFPDKSEADAWDFYKGKAGEKFTYCAKKGYTVRTRKESIAGYIAECAECVKKSSEGVVLEKIDMLELMKKNGEPLILNERSSSEQPSSRVPSTAPPAGGATADTTGILDQSGATPPTAFDWRNYNGHTYIGPVRDQGACGSCYSFGAAAAAEGAFNFANSFYDGDCIDFSESFIIWCLSALPEYGAHFGGCDGADYEYAELDALVNYGITEEAYYPYTITQPSCCTHAGDPSSSFHQWGRAPCGDIEAIKTAIMTYGVVDAAVNVTTGFQNYSDGIFSDTQTTCPDCENTTTNHAIALVGWGVDEVLGEYWILRNSWGGAWGEDGYMRIAVHAARVACAAAYLDYGSPAAPVADFMVWDCNGAGQTHFCSGSEMTLRNTSANNPGTWEWEITPGAGYEYVNGSDSSSQHPSVLFSGEGFYTVSLTVANGIGSDTITRTDYVCVIEGQTIRLDLTTDNYGDETTWDLKDDTAAVLYSGGPYPSNDHIIRDLCLNAGNYVFTIYDAYGDGICCQYGKGNYSLTNLSTGQVYKDSNGRFGAGESTPFSLVAGIGDIDGNMKIEMKDSLVALQVSTGMNPVPPVHTSADVNGDSKIGTAEAVYVMEKVATLRD